MKELNKVGFIIENILVGLITSFMYMFMWNKLLDKKYDFRNIKTYIVFILLAAAIVLNYLYNNQFLRILIITIIFMFAIKIVFKEETNICIMTAIMSQLIGLLSEVTFALFALLILQINESIITEIFSGKLCTIIFLFTTNYIWLKINLFKRINNYFIEKTKNLNKYYLLLLSGLVMIIYNYLIASVYYQISIGLLVMANVILIIIYTAIIFSFLATKNDYNEISNKYVNTLSSLKEYEEILDKYRVSSHENKNQLLTIRAMIVKKEKKLKDYIDSIIDTISNDNEKIMYDTNKIPSGGLRAIIYSKMLSMKDKSIDVNLDIERNVRLVELINLSDKVMLDICKIMGVFLDNAIEEVEKLSKKEILIKLYVDNKDLCISITNNYKGKIQLDKISNKGYTTKENGHGYGLTLVKNIINNNGKMLENNTEINNDYFTQILIIKNVK